MVMVTVATASMVRPWCGNCDGAAMVTVRQHWCGNCNDMAMVR